MQKHGLRLMKKYGVPADLCPNLDRYQSMAFVKHLLYRYYQEGGIGYDNWKELTQGALPSHPETQADFLNELAGLDLPVKSLSTRC